MMGRRVVAVIGGGVTGLVAARRLAAAGCAVHLFEASDRLGGQVRTLDVLGHPVDVGAESLHLAGPAVVGLLDELDLTGRLVTAETSFAWIWDGRRRRRLPAGVGPAGPTRLMPVVRDRVLSPLGMVRAALEPVVPARDDWNRPGADVGVGPFVARRFGRQVADRLVDPVLGSLHAGDVDQLSLRAATPMLAAKATRHRSLLLGSARGPRGAPSFVSFPGGLATMIDQILAEADVDTHLGSPVRTIEARAEGYALEGDHAELGCVDGVVLALPAAPASRVLRPLVGAAADGLDSLRTASVATVVVAVPRAAAESCPALRATGLLTPSTAGSLLKAATFLGTKWPHLRDDDHFLLRLSAGRVGDGRIAELDDAALVERLLTELDRATGLAETPLHTHVERWPSALPQLEVGHLDRLAAIRAGLAARGGLHLAGAAYDGLGVATCVRSGHQAADELLSYLDIPSEVPS